MTKAFGDLASLHRSNITTSPIIHLAAQKTVERLFGPTDHRFVFVKRSVEHHRHASEVPEAFDEAIVARIGVAVDCLQAAGAIDMRDGWSLPMLFFRISKTCIIKGTASPSSNHSPTASGRTDGERRSGSRLFDLGVENGLHIHAPRIAQGRAVTKCARSLTISPIACMCYADP